ncbi:MAG: hypothetical protein AB7S57_07750 [Acetobacteraceae bacterium]
MGQVVTLSLYKPRYPSASADLAKPECVFLIACRWWVVAYREQIDPLPRLCNGLALAGAPDAAFSVDALMAIVARTGQHTTDIRCPRCPGLSDDERHLLHAARLTQTGRFDLAERSLSARLLTADGARFAVGPLEGLGVLFAEAGMFFGDGWRSAPGPGASEHATTAACTRGAPTIH